MFCSLQTEPRHVVLQQRMPHADILAGYNIKYKKVLDLGRHCLLIQSMTTQATRLSEQPLTSEQIARHFQISMRTLANWRASRRIPFWKINSRNFRYKLSDCEAALSK
jgi:Helix-turn-helix domain